MSTGKRRQYHSPTREAQALETRQRILHAAAELFATHGVAATTIEAIARGAEVSAATVYLTFSGKRAIAAELVAELKRDAEVGALYQRLMAEPRPRRQLALAAAITRRFCQRAWGLMDAIGLGNKGDRELRGLFDSVEERRLGGIGALTRSLAERRALKASLTADQARDVVWTLCAHDLYRLLVADRGWSPDAYEEWLAHALADQILH